MREALSQTEVRQLRQKVRRLPGNENVLIFEVAVNVATLMRERQSIERLRDDRYAVFVSESPALHFGELLCICAFDVFSYEVNDSIVCAAIDELDNVFVFKRRGNVHLAHEATHCFVADSKFRQQGFDRDWTSSALLTAQHHCAHSTTA